MPDLNAAPLSLSPEVAAALDGGRPVVALESTILAHGLPAPDNLAVAAEIEQVVRAAGAVPATIAVLDGRVLVGLTEPQLERICSGADIAKLSVRDLPVAVGLRRDGATTVASTSAVAQAAGIAVFATGGLGGVHREAATTFDESADLSTLAATRICVVSAGVKSILDVAATLERLESLSVAVLGFRTNRFPGFYLADSGHTLDWRVESAAEVAAVLAARDVLPGRGAVVVANPLPESEQLDPDLHDRVLAEGLALVAQRGVRGKDVTPVLLEHFHRATDGASLATNIRLVLNNARLAAEIAVARTGG